MSTQDEPGAAPASPGATPTPAPAAASTPPQTLDLNLAEKPELDASPDKVGKELRKAAADGGGGDAPRDQLETRPYDYGKARDRTREIVTLWLIGVLCVIVVLAFVGLFARGMHHQFDEKFFAELKQVLDVLLGPVITLLSSAVGFYFGYQQGAASEKGSNTPPRST
jgi:hypothetical protein